MPARRAWLPPSRYCRVRSSANALLAHGSCRVPITHAGRVSLTRDPGEPSLVAFANRLPIVRSRGRWQTADGGLVAALRPVLEGRDSTWVGWDGGGHDVPAKLSDGRTKLVSVELRTAQVQGYYHGFSNRTLWPLFHGLADRAVFERRWWRDYRAANEAFAEAGVSAAPTDGMLWVHDYHLALLPALLRRERPEQRVGFFLHIPFPEPAIFARLPWRTQLLDGLLGADLVSFQTEEYRESFVQACRRLGVAEPAAGEGLLHEGRPVATAAHPISIDAARLAERAASPQVERALARLRAQFGGRRVLIGVDRLDYTKGIVERLRAVELLLEQRPALRSQLSFVQIAVPSRGEIREYRRVRSDVEHLVGRINGRFTRPGGDVPVHYLYRGVPPARLLAYYRLADVCLVTALRDGMNLVAKEYAVCQAVGDASGALVLSEFAGATEELPEAIPCNPFDVEGVAAAVDLALELDEEDRRRRITAMAAQVRSHDVFRWLDRELASLAGPSQ